MKAFVAGSTGQTGQRIVKELVKRNIPVRALVRDLESAKKILPPEAELIVGDILQPEGLTEAMGDSTVLVCATGASPSFDPSGPYKVDYVGTKNLINTAKVKGIQHFVIVSSLCVSQFFHPLNLFWLILYWKKQAEDYLISSGLTYTIVRPGGLKNEDNSDPIVMTSADTRFDGSIPRDKVAEVCVEALFQPAARNKIVEIVTISDATSQKWEELFANVA